MGSVASVKVNGYKIEPGANLADADLTDADLTDADLTNANLKGVIGYKPQP